MLNLPNDINLPHRRTFIYLYYLKGPTLVGVMNSLSLQNE